MTSSNSEPVQVPPPSLFLPHEIVEQEIVPYLDTFSIQPFLEAFPVLKENVILLTDHPYPPVFFHVKGITRRNLGPQNAGGPETIYFREAHRSYGIRLFELMNQGRYDSTLSTERFEVENTIYGKPSRFNINKDFPLGASFVFVSGVMEPGASQNIHFRQYENLYSHRVKWHVGLPMIHNTHWRDDVEKGAFPMTEYIDREKRRQVTRHIGAEWNFWKAIEGRKFNGLRSVTIQTAVVKNLDIPYVRDLALDFSEVRGARPVISNVNAPALATFVIKVNRNMPVIEENNICGFEGKGMFELSDVSGIQANPQLVTPHDYVVPSANVDLSFLSDGFNWISLNGFSNTLFQGVDLRRVETFNWNISLVKPDGEMELDTPSLKNLWVNCYVSGSILPRIEVDQLEVLSVIVGAREVDISRVLCAVQKPVLKNITILQYEHILEKPGPIARLEEDWFTRSLPDGSCQEFEYVCLSGFDMKCVGTEETVEPLTVMFPGHFQFRYQLAHIAPVLRPEDTHCAVRAISMTPNARKLYFVPIPLVRGTRASLAIESVGIIPHVVRTPLCLEDVTVDGKPLSMIRGQSHPMVGRTLNTGNFRTSTLCRQFYTWLNPGSRFYTVDGKVIVPEATGCHPAYVLTASASREKEANNIKGRKREECIDYELC